MKLAGAIKRLQCFISSGAIKKKAELDYWRALVADLTKDCREATQKQEKLLNVCWEITYPRYLKDLFLNEDSFKGKKVLDVGCGPHGGLIGFKNCEKYAADHLIDEYKKLGYPLEKHGIRYFCARSEKLPFEDGFFDVVTCVNALDHVDSLENTLREIARVLKNKGKFIGQINFHPNPTETEPIVMDHAKLIGLLLRSRLILEKRVFQCRLNQEDRYYYECEKDGSC